MTLTTFSAGVNTSFTSQLNTNFNSFKVITVYTGTAFNSSQSGAGTTTNSYETALITTTQLAGADYLLIKITHTAAAGTNSTSGTNGYCNLKLEEKYSGGGYSTLFDVNALNMDNTGGSMGLNATCAKTIEYIYTLTANDKANGVYLKFSSTSFGQGSNDSASLSNICTSIQAIA
jgi:hypothetical protein